ncbi:MAG: CPBP family glutamic-type intramembrane protease, partial [Nocardioides sp.]
DWLDHAVRTVLAHADQGIGVLVLLVTVLNGVAEELFFRGAVYAAIPRHPALWSTVLYVVATAATGNPMLAFAALAVGTVTALQRRASGGVLAPILTHCTWSVVMLYALPAIF